MDGKNELYFGDNLKILRDHIADSTVGLIYLDPPFNSNANYNVLFKRGVAQGGGAATDPFRRGWACPALVVFPWCGTGAGQAQPLRNVQIVC
jgi:hypothetical protein